MITGVTYRTANVQDIAAVAEIRAVRSGTNEYWRDRIQNYLNCQVNPQQALQPRFLYVALYSDEVIGFVAGHLTRRLNCEGEVQWIDTDEQWRRKGVASRLLKMAAMWFSNKKAYKVCVDPGNDIAKAFYFHNNAKNLNEHWLYWEDIRILLVADDN